MSEEETSTCVKPGAAESVAKDIKENPDLKKSNARRNNDNQENSHTKTIDPDGSEAESWVDRYGELLYRFAMVRVKDPVIAEDLVQETFLAALRGRENFQGRSSLKSWLVAILKHKIVDHIRKSVKEKVFENFDSLHIRLRKVSMTRESGNFDRKIGPSIRQNSISKKNLWIFCMGVWLSCADVRPKFLCCVKLMA